MDSRYSAISLRVYWKKGMSMLPLPGGRCGAAVILFSLYSSVLLPRRLGYKEYLRIFSDILLPRRLGYREYLRIFFDILLPRKLGSKNILKYSPIFSIPEHAR